MTQPFQLFQLAFRFNYFNTRYTVTALASTVLALTLSTNAHAQLNIQTNPVFSTPTPSVQEVGPQPPAFKSTIVYQTDDKEASFKVGQVSFEANHYFNDWTIRRYLKPLYEKQGATMTPQAFEALLKQINQSSKFKVNATLKPRESINSAENTQTDHELGDLTYKPSSDGALTTMDVQVEVLEQQPFQITGTFDNAGRPGVGMYRGGLQVVDDSLLGFGDKLSVQYVGADDAHRLVSSYTFPMNRRGGTLDFTYIFHDLSYDRDLTFHHLPQVGQDHAWITTFSQPIDSKKVWTAYSSMLFRHVTIERNDVGIVRGDPRPLTVGLIFNKPDAWGSTWINAHSAQNFDWFGTDSKFWRSRIDAKRVFNLPHKHKIVLRAAAQYSPDALPPVQEFQIGGAYTVRGYSEGLITGDRGHFYSLEHYMPIPGLKYASPWLADRTQWVSFVDFGQSWLDQSNTRYLAGFGRARRTTLFDVGFGLRYRINQYLQGFVDTGFGLYDRNLIELGGQPTARIHMGVRTDLLPKVFKRRG